MNAHASPLNARLVFGVALVVLGALWTLDNLDLVNAHLILRWWPSLLILYGVTQLMGIGRRRNVFWGTFVTFAGILLLMGELDLAHVGLDILWPLFLIAIGVQVLLRATGGRGAGSQPTSEDSWIRAFAAMGGVTRRSQSTALEGADLSAVMGGVELDLRDATPAPGGRVIADVFVVWGGIVIVIPDTWKVESEVSVVMAALEDKTRYSNPEQPAGTLVLRGAAIMGGVEVRNARNGSFRGVQVGVVHSRRRDPAAGSGAGARVDAPADAGTDRPVEPR